MKRLKKLTRILHFCMWNAVNSSKFTLFHFRPILPIRLWFRWWEFDQTLEINMKFITPRFIVDYPLSVLDDYCLVYGKEICRELFDGNIPF